MKINLWGVRGSIPTSSPDTKYYGGNTSCMYISEDDDSLILDAGSGIQGYNSKKIPENKRIHILLTHLHLDHIQGLGFFNPFFNPDLEIHIWGPTSSSQSLHSRLSRYLSPPLFPVRLRDLPCKLLLHEIGNSVFEIEHFKVQSAYVIHPGPTVGYRVMGKKSVYTYIPDHEPALGRNGILHDKKWISGYDIAANTDLLYHDGQYTGQEYKNKIGWGHSSFDDVLLFSAITGVKQLLIGHHDPMHSDNQLNDISKDLHKHINCRFNYEMAVEGMEIDLP